MADEQLAKWEPIFPWMERTLGGRIVRRERQGRESGGRFAWFVDLEVDGRIRDAVRIGTKDFDPRDEGASAREIAQQ